MPALAPTDIVGRITWLGRVLRRDDALASTAVPHLPLTFAGPDGEDHGGLTRPSCSRVVAQYPRGTTIRNTRQLSILSDEDLAAIADALALPALDPAWLGATMVLAGIPDFSFVPPGSRLQVEDGGDAGGATVAVDMQNRPCHLPAPVIAAALAESGAAAQAAARAKGFKAAAAGRRGVTAWVEREGVLEVGAAVRLHVPDQRGWRGPA